MHAFPLFALTVASSPLAPRVPQAFLAVLAPIPEVAFVLQSTAVGTAALGSVIALRAKRRYGDADTWAITTTWATLGLVVGVLAAFVSALA